MFSLRITLLVLLLTSFVKAEPLELTIYALRNSSDLVSKTYSYDVVSGDNLDKVSSINLVQSGPDGQMTSLFTRGTNSNHTLITLNGISIKDNSTPLGTDDISQHWGYDTLEVIKGPMSSVYGPNAIGGVINMISYPTDENSIDVSYGTHDTKQTTLKLGQWFDSTLVDLRLQKKTSDGISVVDGDEKDGYNNANYNLQVSNGFYNFKKLHTENKSDLDGMSDTSNYTSTWKFDNNYVSYKTKDTEVTLNNATHKRKYDKSGTIDNYKNTTNTVLASHTLHNSKSTSYTIGSELELTDVKFDTAILGYVSNVDKSRSNAGIFTSVDHITDSGYFIHSGVRYDNSNTFDNQVTYRLATEKDGYRASISTGYKAPTVYEMYGKDNYGFLGNSNLTPEKSITYEIGYRNQIMDLALFTTDIDNMLQYSNNTYINNSKKSNRHGAELGLTYELGSVILNNNTTFTIAEDGDGNQLTRRPHWMNNLNISYKDFGVDVNYYGSHLDIDNQTFATKSMPSTTTIDLFYNHTKGDLTFYGKVGNITDVDYERPDGYNQLGRTITLGFKKTF